jgi:hypothetical protein
MFGGTLSPAVTGQTPANGVDKCMPMPRYYFAIEGSSPEEEGEELADDAAALAKAQIVEHELGRGSDNPPRIVVFNERGVQVRPQ